MKSAQHIPPHKTALERLNERFKTENDSARCAERIELLGQVMFGDLWRPIEEAANEDVRRTSQEEAQIDDRLTQIRGALFGCAPK